MYDMLRQLLYNQLKNIHVHIIHQKKMLLFHVLAKGLLYLDHLHQVLLVLVHTEQLNEYEVHLIQMQFQDDEHQILFEHVPKQTFNLFSFY
jgi:hypothetical protein